MGHPEKAVPPCPQSAPENTAHQRAQPQMCCGRAGGWHSPRGCSKEIRAQCQQDGDRAGGTGGAPDGRDLCEEARMGCPAAFCSRFCSQQDEGRARARVHFEQDFRRSGPLLIILLWQLRFGSRVTLLHTLMLPALKALSLLVPRCCSTSVPHWAPICHTQTCPSSAPCCAGPGWAGTARGGTVTPIPSQPCHPGGFALVLAPKGSPDNDPEQFSSGR